MIVLLESGIDPCSREISSGFVEPCFEASALHMEVSESIFSLQIQFEYQGSGPLALQASPTRTVLDVTQSFNVVFSSDRSSDRFTGKPVSQTTGLYYYYHRWYDPSVGRFISPDPKHGRLSNPQSLNLYIYALDLPTGITDPMGEDGCWIFSSICDTVSSATSTLYTGTVNAWNGLTPEERQGIILAGMIALTAATGGAAAPLLVGVGLAVGAGAVGIYAGYSYATGQQMTLSGALTAFTVGFGIGVAGAGLAVSLGSDAADVADAFSATREGVGTFDQLGPEVGGPNFSHPEAIEQAGGLGKYWGMIKDTIENGVDTSSIESNNDYLTFRSTTSKFFVVADPNDFTVVTAFFRTPAVPQLAELWNELLLPGI